MSLRTPEEQYRRMLETPIPKLVASLAAPTVLSQLVTIIYNTADTWFVAKISTSASAGVGIAFAIQTVIQSFGFGLGMGSSSLASVLLGKKKNDEAEKIASSAFFAALTVGLLIAAVCLPFLTPLMGILGATETSLPYARDYAFYILLVAPLMCSSYVMNNTLRSQGKSNLAMIGLCSGSLLNIALDPLFIFTFGLGTAGAAAATAISQCVSFLILLSMFLRGKSIVRLRFGAVSRSFGDYRLILGTGFPSIIRQGFASVASALLNVQASVYGDAAVAAITIANKIYMLVRNVVLGFGQGFMPVAGYNYGAGKMRRTRQAFLFTAMLGTIFCTTCAIVISLFAGKLILWFRDDAEVVAIGTKSLLFGCAVMPFMAFSTYVNQMLQCLGFKLPATLLASCRQGFFFLPLILALPPVIGLTGVQITQPGADLLTFVSVPAQLLFFRRHLKIPQNDP